MKHRIKLQAEKLLTRLFVVRADRGGPWCMVDPARWFNDPRDLETAAVEVYNYGPEHARSYEYRLNNRPVVLCAYVPFAEDRLLRLRFDDKNTFPIAWNISTPMARRFIDEHPNLTVRLICRPDLDYIKLPAVVLESLPRRRTEAVIVLEEIREKLLEGGIR
ncbi:MAG: hypothetical protein GF399_12735 [Candidatus Coatesbacteria bacterium]|nr:hypothetical protein [Candidatus Coatesbacteria bacterium]